MAVQFLLEKLAECLASENLGPPDKLVYIPFRWDWAYRRLPAVGSIYIQIICVYIYIAILKYIEYGIGGPHPTWASSGIETETGLGIFCIFRN